jgi:hypothetical protein
VRNLSYVVDGTVSPEISVTALQARTFAVWTLTSAMVRAYAAYHINDKM